MVAAGLLAALLALPGTARAAEGCDGLTARVIRATGASLAGRSGSLAVFRAADADRMSLDCKPRRMVFGAREREPDRAFFLLVGLAATALAGARAEAVEMLALTLHQRSLLTGAPQEGIAGRAALRCETGPREDGLADAVTVCVLVPNRPEILRRRAGLGAGRALGAGRELG